MTSLYRIVSDSEWRQAERDGIFRGSAHDARDGFVHLSAAHQVAGTLSTHYAARADLVLLTVDADALVQSTGSRLEWEPSRGGELFPHLYGEIPTTFVKFVQRLTLHPDGKHALPPL